MEYLEYQTNSFSFELKGFDSIEFNGKNVIIS